MRGKKSEPGTYRLCMHPILLVTATTRTVAYLHENKPFPMITSGRLAVLSNVTADEMALLSATITGGSGHRGG